MSAIPVVDAVPTVAMINSPPPWADPPNVVAAPIWTSAPTGFDDAPIAVEVPTVREVDKPSSLRLYESVVTL